LIKLSTSCLKEYFRFVQINRNSAIFCLDKYFLISGMETALRFPFLHQFYSIYLARDELAQPISC